MYLKLALTLVACAALMLIGPKSADAFGLGGMKGRMGEGRMRGDDGGNQEQGSRFAGLNAELAEAFIPKRARLDAMEKRGFLSTGLEPVYPDGADCPRVGSSFTSPYRSDGSRRQTLFFEGLHGGMDIAQPEGTPLLAVADGEIIVKHEGEKEGIGGLGLWVRHSPEDTGLGKYVFVEYKHIARLPDLAIGERVKMGQVIAETGNTGTTGGHYGSAGFHHLHMTAYWSDGPEFRFNRVLIPMGGQWLDPLALMRGGPLDSRAARDLPADQKKVQIPYKTTDGRVFPESTKVVWPYACRPKQGKHTF